MAFFLMQVEQAGLSRVCRGYGNCPWCNVPVGLIMLVILGAAELMRNGMKIVRRSADVESIINYYIVAKVKQRFAGFPLFFSYCIVSYDKNKDIITPLSPKTTENDNFPCFYQFIFSGLFFFFFSFFFDRLQWITTFATPASFSFCDTRSIGVSPSLSLSVTFAPCSRSMRAISLNC